MSPLDAAYNVVHGYPGGSESLGPRLGKSGSTLSAELTRRGSSKFGLETAVMVTQLTGDLRILHAFAESAGQMCVPLPGQIDTSDDVLQALGEASREFADLCREVCTDMSDGEITDNELDRIETARGALVAGLHHLGEAIRARNLAAKPAFVRITR